MLNGQIPNIKPQKSNYLFVVNETDKINDIGYLMIQMYALKATGKLTPLSPLPFHTWSPSFGSLVPHSSGSTLITYQVQ